MLRAIKYSPLLVFLLVLISSTNVLGQQPTFESVTQEAGMTHGYSTNLTYASGMSVRDFDQDGWDDITVCTDVSNPPLFFKNYYGVFEQVDLGFMMPDHENYIAWIDYDNDGDLDCYGVNEFNGVFLRQRDSNGVLIDVTSAVGLGGMQTMKREGGVWADFNNDGLLDLHVSVFETTGEVNALFFQDSNHNFVDVSNIAGIADSTDFTFHVVAIDYNEDGWMDFYEANDGHTGNLLFKNNGDSTFTEVSSATGTYHELDAMGIGIGDFDGDLDFDMHVTDRYDQSILLRNNGDGTYTEVGIQHNLDYLGGFGWGNNFFDADLDGDNDIYISGMIRAITGGLPSLIYINDGNGYFNPDTLYADSLYSFSNAIFDLNNDRLPDIVSLNSSNYKNSIWKNTTATGSKRFSIRLEGCESNRDAFGSEIIAYDGTHSAIWSTHSTQSYTAQNSDKQIIPILNGSTLDSLRIKWPLGGDTVLFNVKADQTISLSECGSARPYAAIGASNYADHRLMLCPGDSIQLYVDGSYDAVSWSNGSAEDTIIVTSAGTYGVTVTNQFGITSASTNTITIGTESFPQYSISVDQPLCFNDGRLEITPNVQNSNYTYEWNTGSSATVLEELTPGLYEVTITNDGFCPRIESITLNGPDSLNPISIDIDAPAILCNGDSSVVLASGTGGYGPLSFHWSNGASGPTQALWAGTHDVLVTDPNGCEEDTSFILTQPDPLFVWVESISDTNESSVGMAWAEVDGGIPPYSIVWNDPQSQTGDTAFALLSGDYHVDVFDLNQCLFRRSFEVKNKVVVGIDNSVGVSANCHQIGTQISITHTHEVFDSEAVRVYDMVGRSIPFKTAYQSNRTSTVEISQPGIFILRTPEVSCKVVIP